MTYREVQGKQERLKKTRCLQFGEKDNERGCDLFLNIQKTCHGGKILFSPVTLGRTHCDIFNLQQGRFRTNLWKNFLPVRAGQQCSKWPTEAVGSTSLEVFWNRLDRHLRWFRKSECSVCARGWTRWTLKSSSNAMSLLFNSVDGRTDWQHLSMAAALHEFSWISFRVRDSRKKVPRCLLKNVISGSLRLTTLSGWTSRSYKRESARDRQRRTWQAKTISLHLIQWRRGSWGRGT